MDIFFEIDFYNLVILRLTQTISIVDFAPHPPHPIADVVRLQDYLAGFLPFHPAQYSAIIFITAMKRSNTSLLSVSVGSISIAPATTKGK
jgi:hypothetical protein